MPADVIETKNAPAAIGPYAQARLCGGTLYVSGQLGADPATADLPDDVEAQCAQALRNLTAILNAAGFTPEDVVKTTVFLTDMNDFAKVNAIYAACFTGLKPARSCVQVAALPRGARVEIECIAQKTEP